MKKRNAPVEMTEEERALHEQYVQDLTARNQKTVNVVCAVLLGIAMVAWILMLVLDVVHQAGAVKIAFHAVAAALTGFLTVRRVQSVVADKTKDSHKDT